MRRAGRIWGAIRGGELAVLALGGVAKVEHAYAKGGAADAKLAWQRIAHSLCALFGVDVDVQGELSAHVREVRVANHTTYLDILALASVGGGRFLSRHDVASWPLVGRVARRIGTIFVDRSSPHARRTAMRALARAAQEGEPLLVFPEGATAHPSSPLPFQRGAFVIAEQAGIPVVPLAIIYDHPEEVAWVGDMPLLPHVWRRLCGATVRVSIARLPELRATGSREMAEEAQRSIAEHLRTSRAHA